MFGGEKMPVSAEVTQYKEKDVIVLKSGEYYAMIAPFMGSNLLRMRSEEKDIEILGIFCIFFHHND